ncbi:hypothetical protein C9439_03885 [archaeon SCG-AAA382B04]|nr:hypothetical protein C9439_03885 [archaeon SCG-AAA382B04]
MFKDHLKTLDFNINDLVGLIGLDKDIDIEKREKIRYKRSQNTESMADHNKSRRTKISFC